MLGSDAGIHPDVPSEFVEKSRGFKSNPKVSKISREPRPRSSLDSPTRSQYGDLSEDDTDGGEMGEDDADFKELIKKHQREMEALVRKHRMELDRLRKVNKRRARKQAQAATPVSAPPVPVSALPPAHVLPGSVMEPRPETPTPTYSILNESFNATQQPKLPQGPQIPLSAAQVRHPMVEANANRPLSSNKTDPQKPGSQLPYYTFLPSMYPTSGYMGVTSVPSSQEQAHNDPAIQRRQSVPGGLAAPPYPPFMIPYNYMTYHGQNSFQTTQHPHQPIVLPHHWQPQVVYPAQFDVRSVPPQHPPVLEGTQNPPPPQGEVTRPPKPHSPGRG